MRSVNEKNAANLRSLGDIPVEERRAIGAMGGRKTGQLRRQLKEMRDYVREIGLLNVDIEDINGASAQMPAMCAVVVAMYRKAIIKGDVQAAEFIAKLSARDDKTPVNAGFIIQVMSPQLAAELDKATNKK